MFSASDGRPARAAAERDFSLPEMGERAIVAHIGGNAGEAMRVEAWSFPNAQGDRLSGRLDLPDGAPRAWALFAHCFTFGKDILAARRIAAGLAARGIATLRFDFTGLGSSEGDFANTGFSFFFDDTPTAVIYTLSLHDALP